MDFSKLIGWICASLNCASVADLDPWTLDEIYNYAAERLHVIVRTLVLFSVDSTTATATGQGFYELPTNHIATIYAASDGVMLRPSTVAEMEALDDDWEDATSDTPTRWVGDAQGLRMIRLYPPPANAGILTMIYQASGPDLTAAAPAIRTPMVMGDYLALRVLEQARMRQGDAQMLDCAKAFGNMASILEQAMQGYWGDE